MEEQTYKYSKFNVIPSQSENEVVIFNTISLKNATVPRELYNDIKDNSNIDINEVPHFLLDLGILVLNSIDESEIFCAERNKDLAKKKVLEFCIAGTSKCNYNCIYCFERNMLGQLSDMDLTIQDATVDFIINECNKFSDLSAVQFSLFGGEPTLAPYVFKNIIGKLKSYFLDRKLSFYSTITTNGYYLTKELVSDLKESCNLVSAQVTLDGLNPIYAKQKGCSLDSFDIVINNIKEICNDINIQIRLNVSDNLDSLKELITYLANLNIRINMYFDDVRDYETENIKFEETYRKYVITAKQLFDFIEQNNYQKLFLVQYNTNLRKCINCGANTNKLYAIDTQGNLYKCLCSIFNQNEIVGTVYDGITNKEKESIFINEPFKDSCRLCGYLPICGGHCTYETIRLPNLNVCDSRRELLNQRIKHFLAQKN